MWKGSHTFQVPRVGTSRAVVRSNRFHEVRGHWNLHYSNLYQRFLHKMGHLPKKSVPQSETDNCSRNCFNTSYNYAKSPKFFGNFGRNPEFSWQCRNFLKWQIFRKIGLSAFCLNCEIFPKIGASGRRLNRDLCQNNWHPWCGGTRTLGQWGACRKNWRSGPKPRVYSRNSREIPVVQHKKAADVPKIGKI